MEYLQSLFRMACCKAFRSRIALNSYLTARSFQGPAAGVWALMAAALFANPWKRRTHENIFLFGYAALFVLADWFGFFHFTMYVAYPAHVGGAAIGLTFVALRLYQGPNNRFPPPSKILATTAAPSSTIIQTPLAQNPSR